MSPRSGTAALDHLDDDALAIRAQQGDDLAQQALIQRYRRFASYHGRGYYLPGGDADDIVQEALIGLYKAIRDYRPHHRTSFQVFAELCITRQIHTAVKAARRFKHQPLNQYVSISRPRPEGSYEPVADRLIDNHADPADDVVAVASAQAVDATMATMLSGFEIDVLRLFVSGQSYEEIGTLLGRQVKSIDNALQRIKRKLSRSSYFLAAS
ncbi:MAG: sigma-70 family RNA polymerase sigma factor [Actinomycetota bacterium]|nr:sigma-70 family RNA polymerase sigma factor [Actinomycetota bacterium]MDQ3355029.1 sigma-70 family RNA polymerase sigma factor [Actinomycetota bacterium]